ncbi:mannose-1-phosphate guanylyltransferase [Allofrancisella inopinata]|uniref:mannose-1-phosphate guanylyltransferase n=1 Tax=Allofrancisella inopinata TaxID=1085647 RepID=A0AAE6YIZ6_9GAMM|nr:mannose-1-phosphate guanylyltransferase/mannose-6-phosphate isomerase [Allofrancisella inopinata]QIV96501.1 mannose-1-phosphate guanylyltransferase/mannose-6-phosphate isomerase [Allofrancisella inopinata]TDT68505.1 mannose-1-phosphate guanylyltransferase [Allofrancisella inopinata]
MVNLILCGGSGTRLWPVSRTLLPKQFVKFTFKNNEEKESLFQLTIKRNAKVCSKQLIISNVEQYFLAQDQLEELKQKNCSFLLEPVGRNTAPAIALACMACDLEEVVLVTPSDHLIKNNKEYAKVLEKAEVLAKNNNLVTFGITPSFAETGFGYIESEGENVKAFHEKPDILAATKYVEAGNYYWNSGMFMFKAGVFLEELEKYSPKIFFACKKAYENAKGDRITRIKYEDMLNIPEDSIDYAVMERSNKVKVVASDIDWSDLGSFDALYEELPKDDFGNTLNKNHICIDSKNNLIYGKDRKIATVDIEDMIVIDTGDALLLSKKGSSQKVKQVVAKVRKNSNLHNIHLTEYRPWGTYTVLEDALGYKIKRINVKPGESLSLQKHYHRSEHWIVISGTATVTASEEIFIVRSNQSIYIKKGEVHRLANEGLDSLVLIEVQSGDYIGEDDIVRFDDRYGRI